jgi:hypothetical protein
MSAERERITRSNANRRVVAAMKEWLMPLGFSSVGGSSECVFERWQSDRYQSIVVSALDYTTVQLKPFGRMGFASVSRIFRHFVEGPIAHGGDGSQPAFGLSVDYVNFTRDLNKATMIWAYVDEEEAVLAQLHDVVMNFIYATMEQIKTPDDLIDFQVGMLDSKEMFAVGRTLNFDSALRLLTLIRLYRPAIYADVRPRLQGFIEKSVGGPMEAQVKRHLAYIDQPGEIPQLPDRSAWAGA